MRSINWRTTSLVAAAFFLGSIAAVVVLLTLRVSGLTTAQWRILP